jgi:hypothetical protein
VYEIVREGRQLVVVVGVVVEDLFIDGNLAPICRSLNSREAPEVIMLRYRACRGI